MATHSNSVVFQKVIGTFSVLLLFAIGCNGNYLHDWSKLEVELHPPHEDIMSPIKAYERLLVSGSPGGPHFNSRTAFLLPQMGLFDNETTQILHEIKHGVRYLFQTRNTYSLGLAGTGSVGMETALDNIIEPGDRVLVPIYGMWSERVANITWRLGATPITYMIKPYGYTFTLEEIEQGIKEYKPNIVYLVNGETSTGVFQRVEGVGELCHKYDCITVVDVAHTIGIQPFFMDNWKIDVAYCNVQKGVGAPVGTSLISFSDRAVAKMKSRKKPTKTFVYDFNVWLEYNYYKFDLDRPSLFLHSYPVLLLYTLREALAKMSKDGLVKSWRKHYEVHHYFVRRLWKEFPSLEFYVKEEKNRLLGAIFILLPPGMDPVSFAVYIEHKHQIDVGIGLGPTRTLVIRLAMIGANAEFIVADRLLFAMRETLINFNVPYVRDESFNVPA